MQKIFVLFTVFFLFCFSFACVKVAAQGNGNPARINVGRAVDRDLETVRQRIVADLLEPGVDANAIRSLVQSINRDGSWPGINYNDTSRTGFQHSVHLENLLALARAYRKPASPLYKNAAVKKTLFSALDFWIDHDFICENWWWNEMGTPNWMINTLLVMDDELSGRQRTEGARIAGRASLTGFGARAGGDFVPIAGMVAKQGLFKRDEAQVQKAFEVMTAQIRITTDRGIQPDMSFHHRVDHVISIHTYGTNYVNAFAYWAVKTAGTKYRLPGAAMKLLIDYYLDGICKASAFGIYPDVGAENRDLSRKGTVHAAGAEIPQNLLQASDYRKEELEYVIRIRKGEEKPDATWDRFFWYSEYFMHQRKNYYASVRMHSSRQNNVEEAYNEEGLKNHHLADGANYITRTGEEYKDIFPVWDWQKIPGTTVMQRPSLPPPKEIAKKGLSGFAGGVSDGKFGAAAFDFKSPHDPLKAKKAWFFFNREYVCLGSGIQCDGNGTVATTVNQCLLKGDVIVSTKNEPARAAKGQHAIQDVTWVLHDSVAYLFPQPVALNLFDSTATGNWRLITHQANASQADVKKEVLTLWLDHGTHPQNESYAYIVLPGVDAKGVADYQKQNDVFIVANTPAMQAVQNGPLQLTQVVFYEPGTVRLTNTLSLTADEPCLVMAEMNGRQLRKLSVADPTHQLAQLRLKLTVRSYASGKGWQATWDEKENKSTVQIALPQNEEAGKSITLDFPNKK